MILEWLATNPGLAAAWLIVIIISLTVHEFSHALVTTQKGDPTAENAGRVTLNPLAHLDWIGFIPLLLFGFGWAKPVPYNPYNLKDPRKDALHIALAGPGSNLVLAVAAAIALRILSATGSLSGLLPAFLLFMVLINLFLLFFNILPVHPLDGSKILDAVMTSPSQQKTLFYIKTYGPRVLMAAVLISIFTNFNVFFFVSWPSFALCDVLVGQSCAGMFTSVL